MGLRICSLARERGREWDWVELMHLNVRFQWEFTGSNEKSNRSQNGLASTARDRHRNHLREIPQMACDGFLCDMRQLLHIWMKFKQQHKKKTRKQKQNDFKKEIHRTTRNIWRAFYMYASVCMCVHVLNETKLNWMNRNNVCFVWCWCLLFRLSGVKRKDERTKDTPICSVTSYVNTKISSNIHTHIHTHTN